MIDDPKTKTLFEWSRLARENAENAMGSSMFEAGFKASEPIEVFSTWLLVGTATVASFFITSADKLLPFIKHAGFLSCLFGLISRIFALRCKIQMEAGNALRKTFAEHLAKYQAEEEEIQRSADALSITLETGIRLDRLLSEFLKPLPRWLSWIVNRQFKKNANNPQIGYLPVINGMQWQGMFAALQALPF